LDEDPDEGYYPLASFAQCLTKLKSLAIPDCADEYTDIFEEGLASCIAPLHSLTLLHIGGTREGINMAGGGMCVDLRHLTSLQDLSFNTTNACPITTAGLKLLPGCSNITALQLTGNLYEFNTDIEVGGCGYCLPCFVVIILAWMIVIIQARNITGPVTLLLMTHESSLALDRRRC
jgi:hypothetical protein